jgi:aminoglycoside phosphotransferase (APT) family kinase protein
MDPHPKTSSELEVKHFFAPVGSAAGEVMASTQQRDLEDVAPGVVRWLAERRDLAGAELTRCEWASGGLSSETVMVDARGRDGERARRESIVVRLAPAGPGAFPQYDLGAQAAAQRVAAAHGVATAVPVEYERDPSYVGAEFLVMPAVDGHIPAAAASHDPWITGASLEAQSKLFHRVLDVLVTLHAIGPAAPGLAGAVPARDIDAELATWRRYLDWYGGGEVLVPGLVAALDWCAAHRPATEPAAALLWGDARLGNIVFDDAGEVVAVLDWEMATIGAPEHDVAWLLGLERVQRELLGASVPGFPDAAASVAYYERAVGRPLVDLAWFEILALVRSAAVMTRLSYLRDPGGTTPETAPARNPLLGILDACIGAYR